MCDMSAVTSLWEHTCVLIGCVDVPFSLNSKKFHDFCETSSDDVSPIKVLGVKYPQKTSGLVFRDQ